MNVAKSNDEQRALWNGHAGRAWVTAQDVLDRMFEPFEELLIGEVAAGSNLRVLDLGCGAGRIARAIAGRLGPDGVCTGIDISDPLIEAARAHALREGSRAKFVCADAQDYAFEPESLDTIVSRLGVMFFENPVAAFANLRRAASDGAALRCIVWRSAAENPFMTTAERAARPLLPNLPARQPNAPGQFGFADRDRVDAILRQAGWAGIDISARDLACAFPAQALDRYINLLGPVGLALQDADEPTRARVIERVRAGFEPFVHDNEVRFTAACWMIRAQAVSTGRAHG
ncbi:class I SAM-dependent methyltransferase [Bradyrhizobium sp. LjRoot220]|uniref:class I SAM-dependent methyltransferase n=1 Tax=Bradyrhizobium sp. LjRoot220 TaxID=3342284 RepID=UPI003ED0C18A